jgi:exopolyphosphatase/guanosine-5'-triphosphate,3'-diphosphate pyrophosphatase
VSANGRTVRVGAIDVGSNSIRLLVADVPLGRDQGTLITVSRVGESCRLGRGLDRTGRIDPEIAGRAGALAADFVRRARTMGASRLVVGATAALRGAENGTAVASAIGERCGVPVRILSGDEEAQLVYEAVVLGLGLMARHSPCVVFDLGGGSTEVVSGVGERAGRWTSLPLGAVTLTERYLCSTPPTEGEIATLLTHVERQLGERCVAMPESTPLLAGVGGTITVLAALDRGLTAYEPSLLEGWTLEPTRLEALVDRVVGSNEAERRTWAVMGRGRSDIVVAGALVVRTMARRFPSRGLVCSTQGLRYGLARLAGRGVSESPDESGHLQG